MHGEFQRKMSTPPTWVIYTISLLRALGKLDPWITVQCLEGEFYVHCLADMFIVDKEM